MKQRVIAVLLVLLLLAVTLVTGVFAAPEEEDESPELVVTVAETEAPAPTEPAVSTEAQEPEEPEPEEPTEPVETEPEVTEPAETEPPATEPEPEPVIDPEPEPPVPLSHNRLTLRVPEEADLKQDLLFLIRGEALTVQVVLPAGSAEVTVTGLPAGVYTVALDSGWNWGLELSEEDALQSVGFEGTEGAKTVSFQPEQGPVSWLNDFAGGDGR